MGRARAKAKRAVTLAGPGYDGRRELVSDEVEDPYFPGRRERVTRNARHDPIEHLYHKGKIGQAEREAGRRVRELVEALGLDAVRAIVLDGARGGGQRTEFADRRIDAGRRMLALRLDLGRRMTELLVRIAGYGETVTSVAIGEETDRAGRANGACSDALRKNVGYLFRAALQDAAEHFGYAGTPNGRPASGLVWREEGWQRPGV
ncbi:hypothetical protein HW532_21520 [Kaustia mangrovi]|uniref:Uncharacterized protein n=1 Tax=Kaustia mangrovi TaxID=2593653 RepID=A0A7S8C7Y1_9HYPH|nr:hypothetical protein [Kaustia mangrovi]QPC45047.1 hypothetical protein HW532_21520 [Kaustia mangrovi]